MMYFLVSIPPKTFGAVRPAFSATSVKFAIGAAEAAADFVCCADEVVAANMHPIVVAHAIAARKEEEI